MGRRLKGKLNPRAVELCQSIKNVETSYKAFGFDFDAYPADGKGHLKVTKRFFNLKDDFDMLVLCYFITMKLRDDRLIRIKDLISNFKLELEDCVRLDSTLQLLKCRSFISAVKNGQYGGEQRYSLTWDCFQAILQYDKVSLMTKSKPTFRKFLWMVASIIDDSEFSYSYDVLDSFMNFQDQFASLPELKWLQKQNLTVQEQFVLVMGAKHLVISREDSFDILRVFGHVTSSMTDIQYHEQDYLNGTNQMVTRDYIRFEPGTHKSGRFQLTVKTLAGFGIQQNKAEKVFLPGMFTMITPGQINDDFYLHNNPDLELIEKMVSPEHYAQIKPKVQGLTILLTGAPGVGKTSFLRHLAKKTGRPLLFADIASILDCFVGESEKNLKKLFAEAEAAYENLEVTPICVFDEAESLLYKRHPETKRSVEQMNNNLISLLLQNLDSFRGILIFCSNFGFGDKGFDPAIHRRLHIISEVSSPTGEAKVSILRHHFPEISGGEAEEFLVKYPFITPAQIRNLRKKYDVMLILGEGEDPLNSLYDLADKDLKIFNNGHRSIGYKIKTPCTEC